MRQLRKYCRSLFAAIAVIAGVVALLNWLVDPYHVYRHSVSEQLRPYKRRIIHRVAKSEVARRGAYDALLLGDSRVAAGFNADHPALTRRGSVYNLSMAACSLYECGRMIDLVLENQKSTPKLLIWGVPPEFVVCDRNPRTEFDFDGSLLNPKLNLAEYHLRNLLSIDSTRHTLWTLRDRLKSEKEQLAATQVSNGGFTSRAAVASKLVSHDIFVYVLPAQHSYLVEHEPLPAVAESEELLKRCFRRCRERGIELKVVIPPVHAVYLERLYQFGLRDRIEMGKRTLVKVAAESNALAASAPPIEIWDFSVFTGPTTEAHPTITDPAEMNWYQDAMHFRRSLGDLVLNQIFNMPNDVDEFGTRLDETNLEDHLFAQRAAREMYHRMHADQVQIAIEGPTVRR
jgi:hypothetical protein